MDYLTAQSPPYIIQDAIDRTARILEKDGVQNPEAVATSQAEVATGRQLSQPPIRAQPNTQVQELLAEIQAADQAKAKEAAVGPA